MGYDYGTSGADTISAAGRGEQDGSNTYSGYEGNDSITGGNLADTLRGEGGDDTVHGGDGADVIGDGYTAGDDFYFGDGGDDTIVNAGVNGYSDGGAGDDTITSYDGADTLYGGGGDDELHFGNGQSTVGGGAGDDVLFSSGASAAQSAVSGDAGDDLLYASQAAEHFSGGVGEDTIDYSQATEFVRVDLSIGFGSGGAYSQGDVYLDVEDVVGSAYDDSIVGDGYSNALYGGGADDWIEGGAGGDRLDGGEGVDTLLYVSSDAGVVVDLTYNKASGGDAQGDRIAGFENVYGSAFADSIKGDAAINVLDGGAGADTLTGGTGGDFYTVDDPGDRIVEANVAGDIDTVYSSAKSFSLAGQYVENIYIVAEGNLNATGNSLANIIDGYDGDNVLDGGKGADTMTGGRGDDTYYVDSVGDRVIETNQPGLDRVYSSVSYSLSGQYIERLGLTGSNNIDGTGNSLANVIVGNDGANVIDGMTGSDRLRGGAGLDTFVFDTALGSSNVDVMTDFKAVDDTIRLENDVFKGLAAGALAADAFHVGTAAADAEDRIVYNSSSGALFFDRDGTGATYGAVQFATLENHATITNADFIVA